MHYFIKELVPKTKLNSNYGEKFVYEIFFKGERDNQSVFSSYVVHGKSKSQILQIVKNLGFDKNSIIHLNMQIEADLKNQGISILDLIDKDLFTHINLGMLSDFQRRSPYIFQENKRDEINKESEGGHSFGFHGGEKARSSQPQQGVSFSQVHSGLPAMIYNLSDFIHFGFKRMKFKVGKDFYRFKSNIEELLNQNLSLECILDFNGCGSISDFKDWNIDLSIKERVFLEDPVPFELKAWKELRDQGFNLIYDSKCSSVPIQEIQSLDPIIGIKPTKESPFKILEDFHKSRFLVTNNMGSELDHIISAYWANEIFNKYKNQFWGCGLYTRHFFKKDSCFIEDSNLRQKSPQVRKSFEGNYLRSSGWGWDDWLSVQNWKPL